jgi:hypothetical protein
MMRLRNTGFERAPHQCWLIIKIGHYLATKQMTNDTSVYSRMNSATGILRPSSFLDFCRK